MSFEHPVGLEQVGYFRLNGVCVGWTWRAGCTSIIRTMEQYQDQVEVILGTPPDQEVHLFLKNPIERFRSAWIVQPVKQYPDSVRRPDMEEYTDMVLDDFPGWRSPHSDPQLKQHSRCKKLIKWRLEGSTHVCGVPLLHTNITEEEKPLATYRLPDLLEYYAQDIKAWEEARPCQIV